jgi:hypothetical protein
MIKPLGTNLDNNPNGTLFTAIWGNESRKVLVKLLYRIK